MAETLRFSATECGKKTEYGTLICGASNSKADAEEGHSFIFMRSTKLGGPDDDGPYFELDDQSQGAFNIVRKIEINGDRISIRLRASKNNPVPCTSIIVDFERCPKNSFRSFVAGLKKIFSDAEEILRIS